MPGLDLSNFRKLMGDLDRQDQQARADSVQGAERAALGTSRSLRDSIAVENARRLGQKEKAGPPLTDRERAMRLQKAIAQGDTTVAPDVDLANRIFLGLSSKATAPEAPKPGRSPLEAQVGFGEALESSLKRQKGFGEEDGSGLRQPLSPADSARVAGEGAIQSSFLDSMALGQRTQQLGVTDFDQAMRDLTAARENVAAYNRLRTQGQPDQAAAFLQKLGVDDIETLKAFIRELTR